MGLFYDAPTAPPGLFDSFTNIPSVSSDVKTRSYADMILSFDTSSNAGFR
jgi:predicted ABC-type exoprotein transport system permease subunit